LHKVPKYVPSLHYITFGLLLQTTTIVLPLKWGKFKLSKQHLSSIHPKVLLFHSKIKFFLDLVYMMVLKCQKNEVHSLTLQYLHLNQPNKNLIFWMEQWNYRVKAWELSFNKFEFPFQGKTIVVVERCIPYLITIPT